MRIQDIPLSSTSLDTMTNAQLAEEELQQSVMLSEEDAEFEEDVVAEAMDIDQPSAVAHSIDNVIGHGSDGNLSVPANPDADGDMSDTLEVHERIHTQEAAPEFMDEDEDGDAEGEAEEYDTASRADNGTESQDESDHDEDQLSDEDAEGEVDDILATDQNGVLSGDEDDDEEVEEEEAEGVGAVKIKPGETDVDDSASEAVASSVSGDSDQESGGEWEAEAENEDDEIEESEAEVSNLCVFCKRDEDNDPNEEFEAYLACKSCGEHGKY